MAHKFSKQASLARQRLIDLDTEETPMSNFQDIAPPVARADTPELIDADGYRYLNIESLRERGDLVAGYDPNSTETNFDHDQIKRNRELEIARENAEAQNVARLEAEKRVAEEEAKRAEAQQIAEANARNLEIAERKVEEQAVEYEKRIAELEARLNAMAEEKVKGETPIEEMVDEPRPKKLPKRKPKQAENAVDNDLDDFDE